MSNGDPTGLESADSGSAGDTEDGLVTLLRAAKVLAESAEWQAARGVEDAAVRLQQRLTAQRKAAREARERERSSEGVHGEDPPQA